MPTVEIFRPGRHQAMSGAIVAIGAAEMAAIAAGYDPELHEAPVVVGHPAHDKPAYGWIKGLAVKDGGLVADLGEVDPDFAELVRAGRYKKISAALYQPGAASNPKPGSWYLRHVGFLGAAPPAVKGLKPAQFGEAGELGVLAFAGPPIDMAAPDELARAAMALQAAQARHGVRIDIAAAVRQVGSDGAVEHAEGDAGVAALVAAARNHQAAMAEAGTIMTIAAAVRAVERS
jgi:hypothetical protein